MEEIGIGMIGMEEAGTETVEQIGILMDVYLAYHVFICLSPHMKPFLTRYNSIPVIYLSDIIVAIETEDMEGIATETETGTETGTGTTVAVVAVGDMGDGNSHRCQTFRDLKPPAS